MRHSIVALVVLGIGAGLGIAGTTGQIQGTVTDATGAPLPGAQVTISSPALIGGARTEVVGPGGSFMFPAIAPGTYTVRVILDGFAAREMTGINVRLDETTTVDVELSEATFEGEVVVSATSPVVNTTRSSLNQSYTADYLLRSAVGSDNRTVQEAIRKTAGVTEDRTAADLSVFGSAGNENAYYIDGLSTTDPATAGFGGNLNFDAIDEIAVQSAGYEAEYGYAIGGLFNLITKSGGNQFSGSLDVRYRNDGFNESGDHFDPDAQDSNFLKYAVTIGGPLAQDKLWFFLSFEGIDNEETPAGAPVTRQQDRTGFLAKVTWQAGEAWRLVFKANPDSGSTDNVFASPFYQPEAEGHAESSTDIYQVEALGSLGDNLFLTLQAGVNQATVDFFPQTGDLSTLAHQDLVTGVASGNYINAQYSDRDRTQFRGDLSWFVDELGGSHQFKGGLDISDTEFAFDSFLPGGFAYLDSAGFPTALVQQVRPRAVRTTDGAFRTAYLQDSWRLHPGLTLNLGIRYDQATYDDQNGNQVADLAMTQPRIGFAWDATGDGKTVVRGFWGRFMHPSSLTLPNSLEGPYQGLVQYVNCLLVFPDNDTCRALAPVIGSVVIDDPGDFPGVAWLLAADLGGLPGQIDPDLEPAAADQWMIGVEREIFRDTSIGLQYIDKKTDNLFESTCSGNWPPPPAAGSDCSYKIVANLEGLVRDYNGWVLSFETRAFANAHLIASYVYSESKGSLEYSQSDSPEFDVYPEQYVNRYGYLGNHRDHQVKINGYWLLPYRFTLGFDFNWASAFTWTLQQALAIGGVEFLEPRGSREADDSYQLDLQASKGFAIGGSWDFEVILSIANLLGSEQPTAVCEYFPGCGGTLVPGDPIAWQQPRRYELGVRLTF